MTTWQAIVLIAVIIIFGRMILDRLPKPDDQPDFSCEAPDRRVSFRIETILVDDFEVTYVTDWQTGRSFSLYGSVIDNGWGMSDDPSFGSWTGVKIGLLPDWFETSQIGRIRVYDSGGCECFVAFPYRIASDILDDVRRDPNQVVTLRFKRTEGKDGKPTFPIYAFELGAPFD